jgi:uncharacterized protein YndB with AHSA1/START domain
MPLDIDHLIHAVTREVATRTHGGAPARVIVATRSYATTPEDLWDAITNPKRIPRWFLPVTGDFRLGGRYQLEGNASGEVVECEPPRRLGLTWEYAGQVSWVNVRLKEEAAGGTELRLEHLSHESDEEWAQFGPGAGGVGWDMGLLGLDQHLVKGDAASDAVRPEDAMAWMASEEGRTFMKRSSDRWRDAAVAAGADPEAARAAAARTIAAYTGEAPADA